MPSRLFSANTGLSFQRMFLTGRVTFPFSMRNRPSRVRPVTSSVCGSSERMYRSAAVDADVGVGGAGLLRRAQGGVGERTGAENGAKWDERRGGWGAAARSEEHT